MWPVLRPVPARSRREPPHGARTCRTDGNRAGNDGEPPAHPSADARRASTPGGLQRLSNQTTEQFSFNTMMRPTIAKRVLKVQRGQDLIGSDSRTNKLFDKKRYNNNKISAYDFWKALGWIQAWFFGYKISAVQS